jgi:hypothetical protein
LAQWLGGHDEAETPLVPTDEIDEVIEDNDPYVDYDDDAPCIEPIRPPQRPKWRGPSRRKKRS